MQQCRSTVVDEGVTVGSLEFSQTNGARQSTPSRYPQLTSRPSSTSCFPVQCRMKKAILPAAVHESSTVKMQKRLRGCWSGPWKTFFAAASLFARALCKHVVLFKKSRERSFSWNSVKHHCAIRISIAAYVCSSMDALRILAVVLYTFFAQKGSPVIAKRVAICRPLALRLRF